jgi:hypothetical protein
MNTMNTRGRRALIAGLVATAVVAAACGAGTSGGDKAGGAGEPVILRMADTGSSLSSNLSYVPAVEAFANGGSPSFSGWPPPHRHGRHPGNSAPDAEQQVVRDVAAGKADLTYVGRGPSTRSMSPAFRRSRRRCSSTATPSRTP